VDLIEAVHQGDTAAIRRLAANPDAINRADGHGNTPLHYAVARRDLESIETLIKQGALITIKNLQGETAANWFQEYIASTYNSKPAQLAELQEAISENDVEFVKVGLKTGVSRRLRFARGETLLHIAIEAQQKAVIELLLEGINHKAIERLLRLTNSRGLTPLALAQQCCQSGSQAAQGILNYLQAKQHGAMEGKAVSAIQRQILRSPLTFIAIESQEIKALANSFTYPCIAEDFEQLNPLRSTLVKLAYNTTLQAFHHLSQLHLPMAPFKEQQPVIKRLLQRLFGVWSDDTRLNFEQKLHSILDYLAYLIQQRQVDQIIQFSDEISHYGGWNDKEKNKIFLNPAIIKGVVALVTILIHEVTHQVDRSYDFFPANYFIRNRVFFVDFYRAYQLAANCKAEVLTSEKRKLFEIQQRLELGNVSDACLKQNLSRWMAINSAETLAMAILALASMPLGAAQFERGSRETILKIQPQRLSGNEAVTAPFMSPVRSKDHPGQASLSALSRAMASLPVSVKAAGQPVPRPFRDESSRLPVSSDSLGRCPSS
jgi:hypothetical protein